MTISDQSATDSSALDPPDPPLFAGSPEAAIQLMVDLHFSVREGIATLFGSPGSDALSETHEAIHQFLDAERCFALNNADVLAALGVERAQLLFGRSSIEHALDRVVWSESGTDALARSIEDLRLKFLEHAVIYCRSRSARRPNTHPPGSPS